MTWGIEILVLERSTKLADCRTKSRDAGLHDPPRKGQASPRGSRATCSDLAIIVSVMGMPNGTVSLLFTNLKRLAGILQPLGDDEAERLRRTHFRLLTPSGLAAGRK